MPSQQYNISMNLKTKLFHFFRAEKSLTLYDKSHKGLGKYFAVNQIKNLMFNKNNNNYDKRIFVKENIFLKLR